MGLILPSLIAKCVLGVAIGDCCTVSTLAPQDDLNTRDTKKNISSVQ